MMLLLIIEDKKYKDMYRISNLNVAVLTTEVSKINILVYMCVCYLTS